MPRCLRRANKSAPTAVLHVAVAPKSAQVEVSMTTQDIVLLSRAMGTPVPAVVDPSKWFDAAMANPARRAAGIAHIDALLGQLPTEEDAARTPVESERRDALPERPVWTEDGCPCESGKDFGECHGADGTKTPVPGHEEALAEIAFLKRREAEFIAALSPVCDGGQYRADVVTRIEFAKPVLYRAAFALAQGESRLPALVSHAKLVCGEAAALAARKAIQVHGAMGYTWEVDLQMFMKRAWALDAAWGDRAYHRDRLATLLLGSEPALALGPGATFEPAAT